MNNVRQALRELEERVYYSRRDVLPERSERPDGPGDTGHPVNQAPHTADSTWDLSDLQSEDGHDAPAGHRKDPLAGLTPDEMILRCVREMNDDEREVWAEQGAGLLRGRVLYGPLDLLRNDKCWPDEASEEQRDLATYQAMEVCKRRRAK